MSSSLLPDRTRDCDNAPAGSQLRRRPRRNVRRCVPHDRRLRASTPTATAKRRSQRGALPGPSGASLVGRRAGRPGLHRTADRRVGIAPLGRPGPACRYVASDRRTRRPPSPRVGNGSHHQGSAGPFTAPQSSVPCWRGCTGIRAELDRRTDPSLPVGREAEGPEHIRKIRKMGAPASVGIGEPSEAGAGTEPTPPADPELAAVCRASLPDPIRQAMLLLVKSGAR